jgi:glycosyltransferase involved in cell wall biosynthesis
VSAPQLVFVRSRASVAGRAAAERHIVTCEYPPQVGGVADYTAALARELARRGERVHVWTAAAAGSRPADAGVEIHEAGSFSARDLRRVDQALARFPGPRRLFIQWVPHGYGYQSMNVGFCRWVYRRASAHGDAVQLMVHEPFLDFDLRCPRRSGAAAVHRVMLAVLCAAAQRVWFSTESFAPLVRRYGFGRNLGYRWLPIASPLPRLDDTAEVARIRAGLNGSEPLLGHFGTYNALIAPMLRQVLPDVLHAVPAARALLLGRGAAEFAAAMVTARPDLESRIAAPGVLPPDVLSLHLQACDAFVQPYRDGVSSRRTTMMALLDHGKAVATTSGERTEAWWQISGAVRLATGLADLAAAACSLLTDPDSRRGCETRARELYDARCAIGRAADALIAAG